MGGETLTLRGAPSGGALTLREVLSGGGGGLRRALAACGSGGGASERLLGGEALPLGEALP